MNFNGVTTERPLKAGASAPSGVPANLLCDLRADEIIGANLEKYHAMLVVDSKPEPTFSVHTILNAVAEEFGISRAELVSSRRPAELINPRQIAYWLCHTMTVASHSVIGRMLGNKDHSTVSSGIKKIKSHIESDTELGRRALALKAKLEQAAR